ncbi:MAG: Abequosyltransferase RfbV [Elusimicrobia bacterium ADurb.Bin231]|nr:MAG: Abequosyltransferase RfbV [Elusimicrobia bacterium ADurb.Bin231]
MGNKPLVSICIPTFNNARYIKKTLLSLSNQTYDNIEIVVCDNASTDNTEEVVKKNCDGRISYHKNAENIGSAKNFNKCISLASGEYVAIYHSDDIYNAGIVEQESSLLALNPDAGVVFALDTLIDEDDAIIGVGENLPKELRNKNVYTFTEVYKSLLRSSHNFFICPTFMARKQVFAKVGLFEETGRYGDWIGGALDTAYWLRIAERYKVGIINKRLIYRRVTRASGSGQYVTTTTKRANHFLVLDDFLKSPALATGIEPELFRQYEYNKFWDDVFIARNFVNLKMEKNARKHLINSISWRTFFTGIKNFENFKKLLIYGSFLFFTFIGCSGIVINFIKGIKTKYGKFKRCKVVH